MKPDNVLVNYTHDKAAKIRFADVMLADFAETVHETSEQAVDSEIIGAAIFRSPEAMMQNGWTTATDIWSFGAMVSRIHYFLALSYGFRTLEEQSPCRPGQLRFMAS